MDKAPSPTPLISLAPGDLVVIALFATAVLVIGFYGPRRHRGPAEYLLAGRSLTLPTFVMTLVSTWYGGVLGVGEFSYLYGVSNWFMQGFPYYVFSFLFALLLAGKIRGTNLTTIPDKLEESYGRPVAVMGAFLTFLLMTPAPYVLMLALVLQLVTGWGLLVCLAAGAFVTTAYLFAGGFRADVRTDMFEFVVMFVGFAVILPFSIARYGGMDFLVSQLPPRHLTLTGGNSVGFIVAWFFIALWTFVDPAFHQRCYAASTPSVAKRGILVSIIFWFLFDAMTVTAGLYARAALPGIAQPAMAYPLLAEATLPPVAKGLFYAGLLATIMSTLNTVAFVSGTTLGRDIVGRLRGADDIAQGERLTRWGIFIAAAGSVVLAYAIPSVIRLWYSVGAAVLPGLLLPVLAAYFKRWKAPPAYVLASMVVGWLTSTTWLVAGVVNGSGGYPLGIEPMFPGLTLAVGIWAAGRVATRR